MPLPGDGERNNVVRGDIVIDFDDLPPYHPDRDENQSYDRDPLPNVNPNDRRIYPTPGLPHVRPPILSRRDRCLKAMKQLGWFMFYVWVFVLLMIVGAIVLSFYNREMMVACACIGSIFGCMACCGTAMVYGEQDDYEERNY